METKCIQLLDDGVPRSDPMGMIGQYDFGSSPELLFCPVDRREEKSRRNRSSSSRGVDADGQKQQQQQQWWRASFMVDTEEEGGVQRKYTYDPIIRCQPQTEITVNDSLTAASVDSSYSTIVTESSTMTDDVLLQV